MTDVSPNPSALEAEPQLPPLDEHLPPWPGTYTEVGGLRLHVRRTDPAWTPGGAPTALYLHGLGGSSTNWTDLGAQLAPWAYGVAADLPGFGFSEPARDFDFSLSAQADIMIELIQRLDDGRPVQLFGNSMGGAIAILIAARRPELVRTLTLISPAVPDLRPSPTRLSDPRLALAFLPLVGKNARRSLAALTPAERVQQVIDLCYFDPGRCPPHRIEELAEEYRQRMAFRWAMPALGRSTMGIFRDWAARGERSLWTALPKVQAPTLVVWGVQDKVISARKAARTVDLLRDGTLLMLRDTGHVAQMEHPRTVARATLRLWRRVDAAESTGVGPSG